MSSAHLAVTKTTQTPLAKARLYVRKSSQTIIGLTSRQHIRPSQTIVIPSVDTMNTCDAEPEELQLVGQIRLRINLCMVAGAMRVQKPLT